MTETFRSLRVRNYRLWASGAIVSNTGTWMQRTAQDWLVLTQLTAHDATALGIVLSLQFGPQLLLLPVTGMAADRFDRRRILMVTQSAMGLLALGLGLLTLGGHVTLTQVYVFALLLGCAAAFDAPARQAFVGNIVGPEDLPNAVGLNSTSFNLGRLIGPAVAGLLIAAIGTGWVFVVNAASFAGVLVALAAMRVKDLRGQSRPRHEAGSLADGVRYVRARPDLVTIMVMLFLIGTLGMNFPIFLSTMSVSVFGTGADAFGLLSSAMAVGSVTGALLAARRRHPGLRQLLGGALVFGGGLALAAVMPSFVTFAIPLVVVGIAAQTLTTSAMGIVQLSTDPAVRGRVLAILLAVVMGGTPLGAPLVGWVANTFGPRWAIALGAASGLAAAAVCAYYVMRYRQVRIHREGHRLVLAHAAG
jgi:MFS family permease